MSLQYTYDNKGRAVGVFIPIAEWKRIKKKYKDLEATDEVENPPTRKEVLDSIKDGLGQASLHQEGKIKLKSAHQLLEEL